MQAAHTDCAKWREECDRLKALQDSCDEAQGAPVPPSGCSSINSATVSQAKCGVCQRGAHWFVATEGLCWEQVTKDRGSTEEELQMYRRSVENHTRVVEQLIMLNTELMDYANLRSANSKCTVDDVLIREGNIYALGF